MTDFRIEKLERRHAVEEFDCGDDALNRFLVRFAWTNQQANAATTYLAVNENAVVGFYSLAVGQVAYEDAPERLVKGLARYPVPIIILARLAVRQDWQGKGVGAGLLRNAMRRTTQVADLVGVRALIVHAKDESARSFYRHFGFSPSAADPLHLSILVKDLQRILAPEN